MSVSNRQALILKVQKVLRNQYKPVKPPSDRLVLDHLLYACCLENSHFEAADEGFARLQQTFFDWNEVRVTTVTELAETLACLADPSAAAARLKRCLQSVFETYYAFDLESLKKQNLGKAVKDLEAINGATTFGVAYVVQNALGGHAIPCSQGVFDAFEVLGIITPAEAAKGRVPGLERAISKSKGSEFAALLHQLGADFFASPCGTKVRALLVEVCPDAKDRLPKRNSRPEHEQSETPAPRPADPQTQTQAPPPEAVAPTAESEAAPAPPPRKRKQATGQQEESSAKSTRKAGVKKSSSKAPTSETKKSTTKQLSRKKPR